MSGTRYALVVDDDPFIAELLQVLLESRGYDVEIARDGIDVVELKRIYDVILLDLKMPVFDGERLAAYWKLTQPEVLKRVIVLSGYSRHPASEALPAFEVVSKPFDPLALLGVIDRCVAQHSRPPDES